LFTCFGVLLLLSLCSLYQFHYLITAPRSTLLRLPGEAERANTSTLAIFAPNHAIHHECWGFALQFALDSGYKVVHLHVQIKTFPKKVGNHSHAFWRWVDLYKSHGLFPSHVAVKVDAYFHPAAYDFVILPTSSDIWVVPWSWNRMSYASEWKKIAKFALNSNWIILRWAFGWAPRNMLVLDHGAVGHAPTWNHVKVRNYHRRHILTCFRGTPSVRQAHAGHLVVIASGGDEAILRHIAELPGISLRIFCAQCDYNIPKAELISHAMTDRTAFWYNLSIADVYLSARSGSYLRDKLNGAIPFAVSLLIPVLMPFDMAFDMGYDGNQFVHSYSSILELESALHHAAKTNRSEYEMFRNRNVQQNNKLIRSFAWGITNEAEPLVDWPVLLD